MAWLKLGIPWTNFANQILTVNLCGDTGPLAFLGPLAQLLISPGSSEQYYFVWQNVAEVHIMHRHA